jgi:hypothetical protein
MTGRDLLETLLKMDPADLELEVTVRYPIDTYGYEYGADTTLQVDHVTPLNAPLLGRGKARDEVFKVLSLG